MTTPAQLAVLRYLDEKDGQVTVGATRDPQWNDATAERKHARDLAAVVRDDAGLDLGIREVRALLGRMDEAGLVEMTTDPGGATVALTTDGREELDAEDR